MYLGFIYISQQIAKYVLGIYITLLILGIVKCSYVSESFIWTHRIPKVTLYKTPTSNDRKTTFYGDTVTPGHMTNMATMPIYDKNLKKSSSGTKTDDLESWYVASVLEYYQVCSNDDPGLTLTYFTARSNLAPYAFVWEKVKAMDFSETIVVL